MPAFTAAAPGLVQHDCLRYGVAYVSEPPSPDDDELVIPGCGCRPDVTVPDEAP